MFFIIYTLSMLCSLFIAAVGDVFASCKTAGVTVGEKGLQVALPRLSRSA